MNTSVIYPPAAAKALGLLKSRSNDIEIFVEDSSSPNLWVKLIRRLLPADVRLDSVTILGGKDNVLNACRGDQADDGRKKLYIIDADLDLLKGRPKPRLKHLYRLRAYCIENYLLDPDNLVSIATTFDTNLSEADAEARLDYSKWLSDNSELLRTLFVCYATVHSHANSEATVGYSVYNLLERGRIRYQLCPKKIYLRKTALYRKVLSLADREKVKPDFVKFQDNSNQLAPEVFVSAKDYMMPQIYSLMKRYFGMNIKLPVFKVMLANSVRKKVDPYLARRLANICA